VLTDYHMHLVGDEQAYDDESFTRAHIERYVDAARERGIGEIGFTDHVFRFREARGWFDHPLWQADANERLQRYHAAVAAARDDGLPVKVALEVDYLEGREQAIADAVAAFEWDFLLGSVHWVAGLAVDWDAAPVWEQLPADEVWDRYVDAVCAAASTGIYDAMAHPDLAKVFGHRPPAGGDHEQRLADGVAAAGVCAEVSSAGYRRQLGELYPSRSLLELLHARQVPVTLGSDAHAPDGVGRDFERALAELHAAGYRTLTVFDAREPRQVPIDA
jgi:histidinol-phosphatase (PHP family)